MHSGVIKHHSLMAVDLTATGEVTWREVPEVLKAVWTAATTLSKTTKPFRLFGLLTRALAVKGDAFIIRLHYVKTVLVSKFTMHCYFHVNAQLHLRKQGSRKVTHSALSISNFGSDRCISFHFSFSYLYFGQRNNSISMLYTNSDTWTKRLTMVCFNTNTFFDRFVLINWRSKFYCTV